MSIDINPNGHPKLSTSIEDLSSQALYFKERTGDLSLISTECFVCGEYPHLREEGAGYTLNPSCRYPQGISHVEGELKIPSGWLVLLDSNKALKHFKSEVFQGFSRPGACADLIKLFEAEGGALGVPNRCMQKFYKRGPDFFQVSSKAPRGAERLYDRLIEYPYVLTCLWTFRALGGQEDPPVQVPVTPGTYHFRSRVLQLEDEWNGRQQVGMSLKLG